MNEVLDNKILPENYGSFLKKIKNDILQSQLRAASSITSELTQLYWRIGKNLSEKVEQEGWGAKILERLSKDISNSFSNISGFSRRNLYLMKKFAEEYPQGICATAVAQIPWGHNATLMQLVKSPEERAWYANKTVENGWSRNMLTNWIESDLYSRQGKAITNFKTTLPEPQSDLAEQLLKDPYNFSFLSLDNKYREQELEQGLTDHIQKFLLELGHGFAFVGRQYPLEVGGKEFSIDLLFYHLILHCYVVIELKTHEFDPRDTGQMSFYLSAVDDLVRQPDDKPTIGMVLCKTKNKVVVEYALRDNNKPIGIASFETKIVESLPENFKGSLPTVEELETELSHSNFMATKETANANK